MGMESVGSNKPKGVQGAGNVSSSKAGSEIFKTASQVIRGLIAQVVTAMRENEQKS